MPYNCAIIYVLMCIHLFVLQGEHRNLSFDPDLTDHDAIPESSTSLFTERGSSTTQVVQPNLSKIFVAVEQSFESNGFIHLSAFEEDSSNGAKCEICIGLLQQSKLVER